MPFMEHQTRWYRTHDDTSNILHVGTSAGRSEFRGLGRINNTTTAVTAPISTSNGLVAEQYYGS